MPNNDDIPAIMAVAARTLHDGLTEQQRTSALEAIAAFRALSPTFLDNAEQILGDHGETSNAELRTTINNGSRISTVHLRICEALWALEHAEIAMMGKEEVMGETVICESEMHGLPSQGNIITFSYYHLNALRSQIGTSRLLHGMARPSMLNGPMGCELTILTDTDQRRQSASRRLRRLLSQRHVILLEASTPDKGGDDECLAALSAKPKAASDLKLLAEIHPGNIIVMRGDSCKPFCSHALYRVRVVTIRHIRALPRDRCARRLQG